MQPGSGVSGIVARAFALAAIMLGASAVQAQQSDALVIEEITVTAQKRAESVQDVPVAVTAVSGEFLEDMGIQSFSDLTKVSASFTIQEDRNKNESPVNLRGIGTLAFSIGIEPSVAVVIDDNPVPRSGSFFNSLSDIERVEVLRGPQSTLFGKNASAGVINIATRDPGNEFESSVELGVTDDDELRFAGLVSGPLSDTFGVRLTGYHSDRDGHIENLTDGEELDGGEAYGVRAKAVWDASDAVSLTIIGEYNDSENTCCSFVWQRVAPTANFFGFAPPAFWLDPIEPGADNRQTRANTTPVSNSTDWAASLKVDFDLGEYTFSSISGYREWEYDWLVDVDAVDIFTLFQGGPYESEQFTQEFRLTSPSYDSVDFVAGFYYTDIENTRVFNRAPVFAASWNAATTSQSYALFGQANWRLSDAWTLITGIRVNREDFDATFLNNLTAASFAPDEDDDNVLGKIGLQYAPSDDVMIYGSITQGYKAGGYDISSSFNQVAADNPVGAETSDSFELGIKSTLFSGRVQLNVAAFNTVYDDYQSQQGIINDDGIVELRLTNVGKLETQGLEIDAIAVLHENFRINASAAFIDAKIKEFRGADCYNGQTAAQGCDPVTGLQDLSGAELNNSPDVKFTVGGSYTQPLAAMPFDGFVDFSYQWQDELNFDLLGNPRSEHDAYGIFNLSAGIRSNDDTYRVTVFANNLFDEQFVSHYADYGLFFGGQEAVAGVVPRGAERYAGVRLRWNF